MQQAITVTSNNIANANTPGYADESVELSTQVPQSAGATAIGAGVEVAGITRAVNEVNNSQLNSSQGTLGSLNALQTYTTQIDNVIGTTAGGVSTALQNYYSGWSTVANNPTSTASRQALLGDASAVANAFQTTNTQLQNLNTAINTGITSDVSQINSLATSISSLNQQIVSAQAGASGQPPNDLLDQRDSDLSSLSKLVGVSTTTDSNGGLNVFIGSGQPLVLQGSVTKLTTVPNQFNSSQLEVSTATNGNNPISAQITSGDLGGLLAARTQALDPTINQVGQLATAFTTSANAQQSAGLDLNGDQGTALFAVGAPVVAASNNNSDSVTGTASVSNVGSLTSSNYLLSYSGGAYSLTNETTGQATTVTPTNATTTPTITADGLTIVLSGAPANGDKFLIQPTAQAAAGVGVAITDPSKLAASGAIQASAASTNTGGATISSGTVVDSANPDLLDTTTIAFTSATTYTSTVNGVATTGTLPASGDIAQNGWQVQLTGTPAAGDTFTVQNNTAGTGDNRNALASANQQTAGVLSGGTISVTGAASALITSVGSQAQQVNTAQTAQTAVNTQALANVQSVSGVNLDEEAANLLQWQQAYQASAQAFSIGNSTFATFLGAINGTGG
jgi:flagellar hook-associated protein 1